MLMLKKLFVQLFVGEKISKLRNNYVNNTVH